MSIYCASALLLSTIQTVRGNDGLSTAVDDGAIKDKLVAEATAINNAGSAVPMAKLQEQLDRKTCNIALVPASTAKLTASALYDRCRPGVAVLAALYKCGKCSKWHTSVSAAVAIAEPDIFLTNCHVVLNTNALLLIAMTADQKTAAVQEVLAADADDDWAIIRAPGLAARPLPLKDKAEVGSDVYVIGHPDGRYYTFTRGNLARVFRKAPCACPKHKKPQIHDTFWLQITADFAGGSSGGPVLDDCGNVIGIVASTRTVYHDDASHENVQMVFKDCVPASTVIKATRR